MYNCIADSTHYSCHYCILSPRPGLRGLMERSGRKRGGITIVYGKLLSIGGYTGHGMRLRTCFAYGFNYLNLRQTFNNTYILSWFMYYWYWYWWRTFLPQKSPFVVHWPLQNSWIVKKFHCQIHQVLPDSRWRGDDIFRKRSFTFTLIPHLFHFYCMLSNIKYGLMSRVNNNKIPASACMQYSLVIVAAFRLIWAC